MAADEDPGEDQRRERAPASRSQRRIGKVSKPVQLESPTPQIQLLGSCSRWTTLGCGRERVPREERRLTISTIERDHPEQHPVAVQPREVHRRRAYPTDARAPMRNPMQ